MSGIETIVVGGALAGALAFLARRLRRHFAGRGGCCGAGCSALREKNRLAGRDAQVSSRKR